MDNRDKVVIFLMVIMFLTVGMWARAEKKIGWYEGQEYVYTSQAEAMNHVCGEYEQPSTAEKRKAKK